MQVAQRIYSRFVTPLPLRQQYRCFLLLLLQLLSVFLPSPTREFDPLALRPPDHDGSPCRSLLSPKSERTSVTLASEEQEISDFPRGFLTFQPLPFLIVRRTERGENRAIFRGLHSLVIIGSFDDDTELLDTSSCTKNFVSVAKQSKVLSVIQAVKLKISRI